MSRYKMHFFDIQFLSLIRNHFEKKPDDILTIYIVFHRKTICSCQLNELQTVSI